jgi:hypothetical protein
MKKNFISTDKGISSEPSDDYWKELNETKIIYQRDGKHYVFDGSEEKLIILRMSKKKKNE